jgi:hypothetical protein
MGQPQQRFCGRLVTSEAHALSTSVWSLTLSEKKSSMLNIVNKVISLNGHLPYIFSPQYFPFLKIICVKVLTKGRRCHGYSTGCGASPDLLLDGCVVLANHLNHLCLDSLNCEMG